VARLATRQRQELISRITGSTVVSLPIRDALPQLLALAAAAVVAGAWRSPAPGELGVSLLIAVGLAGLRLAATRSDLVRSTFVLDAVGVALLIGGTGNAHSPFLGIGLAGAWWAAGMGRNGALYGAAFLAAYLVLVVPGALRGQEVAAVVYQPAIVAVIGVLGDQLRWSRHPSRWSFTVLQRSSRADPDSVRVGLSRAIRGGAVPMDVLLTAGQLGLTAMQTELIAYLILGLSNQEIADALSVSEATVRYRLTRLYRILDVRGRKAAAERARELGLDALVPGNRPQMRAGVQQTIPK
jgi:DNA-binding CsgD family transcriptional regulator